MRRKQGEKRGKMIYVPHVIVDEVVDIQREDDIVSRPEAFRSLVKYARVGREAKRVMALDFGKSKKLPPVDSYANALKPIPFDDFNERKRKKKNKDWVDEFMGGRGIL